MRLLVARCSVANRAFGLLLLVIVLAACRPSAADFGPLAVVGPSEGAATAVGGTGTVRIGDSCVTLQLNNGTELLLVWHSDHVRWNRETGEMSYSGPDSEPRSVHSGDVITVGGTSILPVGTELDWVAPVDETCTGEKFLVDATVSS